MENKSVVSIITVNYNGLQDTIELCQSIREQIRTVTYELIVVDNGSKVNEASQIQQTFPWIHVIRSEKNLGFSGGNNLGIRQAKGDFIFLLNNDTYLPDDSLHYLVDRLKANKQLAAVSPKIKFAWSPFAIQFAGFTPLSPITLRNKTIGFGESDEGQYDQYKQTPLLHGAAMMVKRFVIEEIGLMPELYFLYYEEIDWCTSMTERGYTLGYEPRCTVFHKESKSTGQNSPLRSYYLTRNRLLFAWRHRTNSTRWLALSYQMLFAVPAHGIKFLFKGNKANAGALIKGLIAFILLKDKKQNI